MNWPFPASDVPGTKPQAILSVCVLRLQPFPRLRRAHGTQSWSAPKSATPQDTSRRLNGWKEEASTKENGRAGGVSNQLSELAEARDCPACLIASSLAPQVAGEDLAPFHPEGGEKPKEKRRDVVYLPACRKKKRAGRRLEVGTSAATRRYNAGPQPGGRPCTPTTTGQVPALHPPPSPCRPLFSLTPEVIPRSTRAIRSSHSPGMMARGPR